MKFAFYLANPIPEQGGAYTFEEEITKAWLQTRSHHEACFCSDYRTTPPPSLQGTSAEYIYLRGRVLDRVLWKAENERRRLFRVFGLRSQPTLPSVAGMLSAQRLRREGVRLVWYLSPWAVPTPEMPYVMTIWDLQHRLQPYFPELSVKGNWDVRENHFSRAIQRASFIVTGTNRGKREIEQFYGIDETRVRVLPLPTPSFAIDDQGNDQSRLRRLNLPPNYLFYPAQFWSHKNHVVLLHALRLLRVREHQEIALVFVGHDHGNLAHVKIIATELGVADAVHFLGFVDNNDLKALYRGAIALAFPSYFGPDNLPTLEAFALGCPVIAADVLGSEEQLGDAALRVPASSEEAFVNSVMLLLRDPSFRRSLVDRGMQRAKAWTASNYVQAMIGILDEFALISRCWS